MLKTGDASEERLARIDKLTGKLAEVTRSAFAYVIGKELAMLGDMKRAETYWRRAVVTPGGDSCCSSLAGFELARLHGTSRPDDDVLDESDLWPAPQAADAH